MGACFDEMECDGNLTESQVQKKFKEYQDLCSYESGNSYSGRLNMASGLEIEPKVFASHSEASDWLSDNTQKWECAKAVKYRVSGKVEPDAKALKLKAALEALESEFRTLNSSQADSIESKLKAIEFISCPTCKSRLETRFRVKTLKCPVCDGSFLSKTELKKREALQKKINAAKGKLQNHYQVLQKKADSKASGMRWLIGAWCSS